MCTDAVNMYTCSCAAGYNGNNCETSKFSVNNLTDSMNYINITEDLQNSFISTNRINRIKVHSGYIFYSVL